MPAAVRREVAVRDGGRCTVVGTERVCGERAFAEHDHVRARALGGEHSVENGRVLCGVHNRRVAEVEMRGVRYAEARREDASRSVLDEVELALVTMGFSKREASGRVL